MANIEKYLYNELSYKIYSGRKPFLVNSTVVFTANKLPRLQWNIDFGKIKVTFKDSIENLIFESPNNLFLKSFIGPSYIIGRHTDVLTGFITYYMTYSFEYAHYNGFVDKPLTYVVDGTDHLIEGALRVPSNFTSASNRLSFGPMELPRKIAFLDDNLGIAHSSNNIYNLKLTFYEQAKPLPFNLLIIGASDDNHLESC